MALGDIVGQGLRSPLARGGQRAVHQRDFTAQRLLERLVTLQSALQGLHDEALKQKVQCFLFFFSVFFLFHRSFTREKSPQFLFFIFSLLLFYRFLCYLFVV